jgi:hypothetical protein
MQLMYNGTNRMAKNANQVVTIVTRHEVNLLNDHKLKVTVMFSKFLIHSKKWH